jgi:diguanylate cyclase (GGDEF)-like protein/PAS domain S-box-containing protein
MRISMKIALRVDLQETGTRFCRPVTSCEYFFPTFGLRRAGFGDTWQAQGRSMNTDDYSGLLIEYGHEILILVDLATLKILAANDIAARNLGYAQGELTDRTITDIVCDTCWEDVRRGIVADIGHVETLCRCADGKTLEVSRSIIHPAEHPGLLIVRATLVGKLRQHEHRLADIVAHLTAALESAGAGLLLIGQNGAIANMNRQFAKIWRLSDETLESGDDKSIFRSIESCVEDADAYRQRLLAIRPDGEDETCDLLTLADGRLVERKSRPARFGQKIIGRIFSFADVTEDKARESRLKLAAGVFSNAHEGIIIADSTGSIIDVNAAFCHITGYEREDAIGRNPRFLRSGRQGIDFYHTMWKELSTYGHWEGELWNRAKSGRLYAERLSISAIEDAGAPRHYVAILSDITELKEYQQQIERMAHYDGLTGVPNRALLADRLNLAIIQAQRYQRPLMLVYLDIDGFKEINDQHGHEAGDQLLVALAHRLRDTLREGDTLARLGGDEFGAVITDIDSPDEGEHILKRLLEVVASPVTLRKETLQLSASLGVTLFPQDNSNADTLLRHAAQAMYQAKQTGKNRYALFDPEKEQQTQTHHRSLERIAQAIEQDEFELYFQPKVNMRTGAVIGVEALIRWNHPERGLVPPGDFLPLIEGSDLVVRLGEWVMDAALRQMALWHGQGLDIAVSVNIAANHLQQPDFLGNLEKRLAAHPTVRPDRFELEVLETAAIEAFSRISTLIENCQALGVSFSLDDFGTGYSSLTYLRRLPANMLKIDQSFVRDMLWSAGDKAIVEGIIGLASAFRRDVIAEGVETEEHGRLLLHLGCDLAQGYGIARPMPASRLLSWAATWRPPEIWASG